jgi:hypothetical protein
MIPKNLEEICELFDCQVLEDYDLNNDDCFYLGRDENYSPLSFELTPPFATMLELEKFCASEEGAEYINEMAGQVFLDWDMEYQEWEDEL